jgi:hypothetical protein
LRRPGVGRAVDRGRHQARDLARWLAGTSGSCAAMPNTPALIGKRHLGRVRVALGRRRGTPARVASPPRGKQIWVDD